jgi:hypothetical protein
MSKNPPGRLNCSQHRTLVVHCASEKRIFSFDSCPKIRTGKHGFLFLAAQMWNYPIEFTFATAVLIMKLST